MKVRDLAVVIAVIMIVVMLIIPLPTWLLSFLLLINISLALSVLLISMNIKEPLQFSVFPNSPVIINVISIRIECFYNSCNFDTR